MKILHIGKYYHPFRGGMESVVKDLCEGLVCAGEEVEVHCSNTKMSFENDEHNDVKVSRTPRFGTLFSQSLTPFLFFSIYLKAKKADVVHLHYPNPLAELASLFIPKDVPLVITYHSDIIRQKKLLWLYAPIQRRILKRADKIIVPTENHINFSPILPEFKEKIEIIPFGLNTEGMPDEVTLKRNTAYLKERHGRFGLFVGRLVKYKGLDVLIEAAREFDGQLLIVGKGPENDRLRKKIKDLGLQYKVHMLGRVDDFKDFWSYFYASEFFVLPSVSVNENFGMVQLEAMFCSKPVITTRLKSGVPLVGKEGITSLLVPPRDSLELAMAMNKLFHDRDLAKKMGVAGNERLKVVFSFDKMIELHRAIYSDLCGLTYTTNQCTLKKAS